MTHIAQNKVTPIIPGIRDKKPRVADTDEGFTRLANALYEELIGANLTKNQARVIHAICRKTYGFNKQMDRIADSQIAQLTRLPRQKVNAAKQELITMKVLSCAGPLIGPNKNLDEWEVPGTKRGPICHRNSDNHYHSDTVPTAATKAITNIVTTLSPSQGQTKDTITKDNKDKINNSPLTPANVSLIKPVTVRQFPDNFAPDENNRALAAALGVDLTIELPAFSDHHRAKGSTFKEWNLALNTWLRNAARFNHSRIPVQRQPSMRSQPEPFSVKDYGQTVMPSWMEEE